MLTHGEATLINRDKRMSKFTENLTPLIVVQAILSIIVVLTFCYQEVAVHSVDPDLKLVVVGVIGFWLGGLASAGQQKLIDKNKVIYDE